MDSAVKLQLVERYIAAFNAFDVEGMLATLSTDVVFRNYSGGQLTVQCSGRDAFGTLAEQAKARFTEREQLITAVREVDGALVVGIACRGTFAADMPGGPAAGTAFELAGQTEFFFTDGRISQLIDRD